MPKAVVTFKVDMRHVENAIRAAARNAIRESITVDGKRVWSKQEIAPGVQRAPTTSEGWVDGLTRRESR